MHKDYDQLLSITTKNKATVMEQSPQYNSYEATPYSILYALFQAYTLDKDDVFVDFGCGKGRLLFYVHNRFNVAVTGIEMNENLYEKTMKNKKRYVQKMKSNGKCIKLLHCLAEEYHIAKDDNVFYLFNPFSVEVFRKVMDNILKSIEERERKVDVILYYPTAEYVDYMNNKTPFFCIKEVQVPGLYQLNNSERFLLYRYEK